MRAIDSLFMMRADDRKVKGGVWVTRLGCIPEPDDLTGMTRAAGVLSLDSWSCLSMGYPPSRTDNVCEAKMARRILSHTFTSSKLLSRPSIPACATEPISKSNTLC